MTLLNEVGVNLHAKSKYFMKTAHLHSKNVKHSGMRIAGMHMFSAGMPMLKDTKLLVGLHINWFLQLLKIKQKLKWPQY